MNVGFTNINNIIDHKIIAPFYDIHIIDYFIHIQILYFMNSNRVMFDAISDMKYEPN